MLPISTKNLITAGIILLLALPALLFGLHEPIIGLWIGAGGLVGLAGFVGVAGLRRRRS
ncbi:MAG: hypothetical protein J0I20_00340 [Chloroflexi bacterium]|nr:hypothetical protein [Chloroflexota bacterium]